MISLRRLALGVAAFVALFQLFSLDTVTLNGDEALALLLKDEIAKFLASGSLTLHPIVSYTGPADFWLFGSLYWITGKLWGGFGHPWMLRVLPLAAFWGAAVLLYRELRRYRESLADWFLLLAAVSPMAVTYSRVAFPHAFLLGTFCFLLAEVFRFRRTGALRWGRIAFVGGLATQFHTTAFLGFAVAFLPVWPQLREKLKAEPSRAALAALLYLGLAYPVLSTFPPPMAPTGVEPGSLVLEIRNFINVISGYQPYAFIFRHEAYPNALVALFFFGILGVSAYQLRELVRGSGEGRAHERFFLTLWLVHAATAGFLFVMCYRGRSLTFVGHERYFVAIVPGWILLQADAFARAAEALARRRSGAAVGLAAGLAIFLLGRLVVPIAKLGSSEDPYLSVSRWAVESCPKERCLLYAENYWNYWVIRYYTRDAVDVNYLGNNWLLPEYHAAKGREAVGCWFQAERLTPGTFRGKVEFVAPARDITQVCYYGLDPKQILIPHR